jgi:PAS domain-containing protein
MKKQSSSAVTAPGLGTASLAGNPEVQAAASLAVRSLAIISTLCRSYRGDHPVLLRAMQTEMARINTILDLQPEFTIYFIHGGVWWETVQLDGGNRMVMRFGQLFSGRGIVGITLAKGVSAEEIRQGLVLLVDDGAKLAEKGLQALLDEAGIRNFRERKEKVVMVSDTPALTPAPATSNPLQRGFPVAGSDTSFTPGGAGAEKQSAAAGQQTPATPPARRPEKSGAYPPGGGVWNLEAGVTEAHEDGGGEAEAARGPSAAEEFRQTIRRLTDGVLLRRFSPAVAADLLIKEFDDRLQKELERHLAILKNMRDAMLAELENRQAAVILTDLQLNVLAMNPLGRKVLGPAASIEIGSPLHEFLRNGGERDRLSIGGSDWGVRQRRSVGVEDQLGVILVVLDPASPAA